VAVDKKILNIVWAETSRIIAADGSAGTKARAQAVVGALAQRAAGLGSTANFTEARALPEAGTPGADRVEEMRTVSDTAVASGQYGGVALPKRAVIWEVTPTGEPRESERQLPKWARWIKDGAPTRTSDFTVEGDTTGRIFRLFESDAEPPVDGVAFVSGLTGSGVPAPLGKINYLSLPWILGILATVLFVWMIIALGWTGRAVTQARDLLAGTQPARTAELATTVYGQCLVKPPAAPAPQPGQTPSPPPPPSANVWTDECKDIGPSDSVKVEEVSIAPAMQRCATEAADKSAKREALITTSSFCRLAWRHALNKANTGEMTNLPGFFGTFFVKIAGWFASPYPQTGSVSLALPTSAMLLSITLLVISLGLGKKERAFGIWINAENRMSLARMQVTLWTVVVLGAYAAMTLFNAGMLSEMARALSAAGDEQALAKLVMFPTIPGYILAALGIAVASPMVASLIKSGTNSQTNVDLQARAQKADKSGIGRFVDPTGDETLEVRPSGQHASLVDFFVGEHQSDKDLIDVSRLQNVVITVILVGGYATMLFGFVRDIAPADIINALAAKTPLFSSLPDATGTFATLLVASHATYLIAKKASANT
jgi:hypothetical protein